jgi:hypothetical protein
METSIGNFEMLLAIVVVIAVLFLLPKKGSKSPLQSFSESVSAPVVPPPVSQREVDRKEALALIEAKLIEQDKQARFSEAVSVISGLQDAPADAKKAK